MLGRLRWSAVMLGVLLAVSTASMALAQEEGREGQAVEPSGPVVVDDQGGAAEPGLIAPAPEPGEEIVIAPAPTQEQIDPGIVEPIRDQEVPPTDEAVIGDHSSVAPEEPLIAPAPEAAGQDGGGFPILVGAGVALLAVALVAGMAFRARQSRPVAVR